MIGFKSFDVYNVTLNSIDDIGNELLSNLRKKEFNGREHSGAEATSALAILLDSLIKEGCLTPAVLWVNTNSDNGFNTKPGKTRFQMYQGFHKLFDLPVVIIDPYRTSDSKKLILDSFPKAKATEKEYDFRLEYNRKKNNHELIPIFNNITNKDLHAKIAHENFNKGFYLENYRNAHTPGYPGLRIYQNNRLIYRLGNSDPVINYHVEYPYEAWYAFAEFMGVLTHKEMLDLKLK